MKDKKRRRLQRLDREATVAKFQNESGVSLLPGDVLLEPTGVVVSRGFDRLSLTKSGTGVAVICEPLSFRTTGLVLGGVAGLTVLVFVLGAVAGADFATPTVAGLLLLALSATAGVMCGLTWVQNRAIEKNHPLLTFDGQSGVLTAKNGQVVADRDDVLCLMLMNSRGRRGKAETTVFQLKLLLRRPLDDCHEAIVLLQNRSLRLDRYHEPLEPFARAAGLPLVECEYDFRRFHLARRA